MHANQNRNRFSAVVTAANQIRYDIIFATRESLICVKNTCKAVLEPFCALTPSQIRFSSGIYRDIHNTRILE